MSSLTSQLKPFVVGFVHGALITFEGQEQGYHSIEEYHREKRKNIASAVQIYFAGHQIVQVINLACDERQETIIDDALKNSQKGIVVKIKSIQL